MANSSVARGCICGRLNPQGPKVPTAMDAPEPTRAGKALRVATGALGFALKSKWKSESSGSRSMRSAWVSAMVSWAVRSPVRGAMGVAAAVAAMIAAAMRGVKCIVGVAWVCLRFWFSICEAVKGEARK